MRVGAKALTSGTVTAAWQQTPYRAARTGSGVQCPEYTITDEDEKIECESPMTTRLRGGMDNLQRPISEYLCETCGTVFVGMTIAFAPKDVNFDMIAVRDSDESFDDTDRPEVVGIMTALRRGERVPRARMSGYRRQES